MSLKDSIKKILRESKGSWSTETKGFSTAEKRHLKFAEVILKERHTDIINYYKTSGKEGGYPNDYDEFIEKLKRDFPKYDYFHQIHVMYNSSYFDTYALPSPYFAVKLLTEYILNYKNEGEQQRIDVVPQDELWDYVKDQYFDCSTEFFEHIWDEVLVDRRNHWNEGIKERMWQELQPELEERMEDEEWQEENGIEFESLSNEEMYFHSYWHYPLQNFGWDTMQLCDYYREYITEEDIINYFFNNKSNIDTKHNAWGKFPIGELGKVYVINRNKLFW